MLNIKNIIFKNYKCFKNETRLDDIKPINVIIGKNNIGKSSVLDIIELMNSGRILLMNYNTEISIEKEIEQNELDSTFGSYAYKYEELNSKIFKVKLRYKHNLDENNNIEYQSNIEYDSFFKPNLQHYWNRLAQNINCSSKVTKRIFAERNVKSEKENSSLEITGYGDGLTTIINNFLNKSKLVEEKVREVLRNKLNEIMGDDANFTEIVTQQVEYAKDDIRWEIFLREENKGRIALSQSGSGLKTILMVLVFTILVPEIEKKKLSEYIFLFEELENNLHPSLERRLLKYIEEIANSGATIFLTTHSSKALDCLQNNDNVQIYNVLKENDSIKIVTLDSLTGKRGCLDDLGIKASDILQSNGIIWVEGPSDRIYINKWIELWSNGRVREGMDYQCVFYGGRLLANTTFDDENSEDIINLINVNRNSAILIDSDKRNEEDNINSTKTRILQEFEENNQFAWITDGKEIENYIPKDIINEVCGISNQGELNKYEPIDIMLERNEAGKGNRFKLNKNIYARKFVEKMTNENMVSILDLNEKMQELIKVIESWNKD